MMPLYILLALLVVSHAQGQFGGHVIYYDDYNNLEVYIKTNDYIGVNVYTVDIRDQKTVDFDLYYKCFREPNVVIRYKSFLPEMAFPSYDSVMFLNVTESFRRNLRLKLNSCKKYDDSCNITPNFTKVSPEDKRFEEYVQKYLKNGPMVNLEVFKIRYTSHAFLNIEVDKNRFVKQCGNECDYDVPSKQIYYEDQSRGQQVRSYFVPKKELIYYSSNWKYFPVDLLGIMNHRMNDSYIFTYIYNGELQDLRVSSIPKLCHTSANGMNAQFKSNFKTDLVAELYRGYKLIRTRSLVYVRKDFKDNEVQHIYEYSEAMFTGTTPWRLIIKHRLFLNATIYIMDLYTCSNIQYTGNKIDHLEYEKTVSNDSIRISIRGLRDTKYVKLGFDWTPTLRESVICETGKQCAIDSSVECMYGPGSVLCRISPKSKESYLMLELGRTPNFMVPVYHKFKLFNEFNIQSANVDTSEVMKLDINRQIIKNRDIKTTQMLNISVGTRSRYQPISVFVKCSIANICECYQIVSNQFVPFDLFEISKIEKRSSSYALVVAYKEKVRYGYMDSDMNLYVSEGHEIASVGTTGNDGVNNI